MPIPHGRTGLRCRQCPSLTPALPREAACGYPVTARHGGARDWQCLPNIASAAGIEASSRSADGGRRRTGRPPQPRTDAPRPSVLGHGHTGLPQPTSGALRYEVASAQLFGVAWTARIPAGPTADLLLRRTVRRPGGTTGPHHVRFVPTAVDRMTSSRFRRNDARSEGHGGKCCGGVGDRRSDGVRFGGRARRRPRAPGHRNGRVGDGGWRVPAEHRPAVAAEQQLQQRQQ